MLFIIKYVKILFTSRTEYFTKLACWLNLQCTTTVPTRAKISFFLDFEKAIRLAFNIIIKLLLQPATRDCENNLSMKGTFYVPLHQEHLKNWVLLNRLCFMQISIRWMSSYFCTEIYLHGSYGVISYNQFVKTHFITRTIIPPACIIFAFRINFSQLYFFFRCSLFSNHLLRSSTKRRKISLLTD